MLVSLATYTLFLLDARRQTFWEKLDDYVYYIKAFGNSVEFCFGIFLFFNGAWILLFESGNLSDNRNLSLWKKNSFLMMTIITMFVQYRWCNSCFYDGNSCIFQYLVWSTCRLGCVYETPNCCAQDFIVTGGEPSTIATVRWCLCDMLSGNWRFWVENFT